MKNLNTIKKPLIILLIIVTIVGTFFAGFYLRPSYDKRQFEKSTEAAQEFVKQVTAGNNDAAYALTAKTLQAQQDKEAFSKAMGDLKSSNPEIQKAQAVRSGDTIVYYQRVLNLPKSSKGSTTGMFYITSVQEDGKWKVASVTVQ